MADLILFNANILPMGPGSGNHQLVFIQAGKISAVAGNDKLQEFRDRHTRVIDCAGKTLLPGFIDAHCHIRAYAESLVSLDLSPRNKVRSISDLQSRIHSFAEKAPPGSWIRGKGYNEFYLEGKRHPSRWDLDKAAPAHPVKLTHRSGHAHVLNSMALAHAGISKYTSEPPGSLIDRDIETGEPTGLLFEMGHFLSKRIPRLDNRELNRGMEMANRELLSMGITSLEDATALNDESRWNEIQSWKERRILIPRVGMMIGIENLDDKVIQNLSRDVDQRQLRLSGVKIILDETTGQLFPPQSELNRMVSEIHGLGLQAAIHAIEETAVESACSAIAYALEKEPNPDHRHHIEHCSECPSILAERLASLGIMVVTQPPFIYYSGDRYLLTVHDEKLKYLYPIGTLMKSGVNVAGSSDCPIVPANPLVGVYSAVSRGIETGKVLTPEEGISPLEALQMYTANAAKITFEENIKGTITPGKMADLVVLNGDPTRVSPDEIKELKVEMTIINGEVVYGDL